MKTFILLLLLIICSSCNAQIETQVWLPEKYVNAFLQKDTVNSDQLIRPIEGFIFVDDKIQILTYRGEISPVKTEILDQNGREKILLHNVHYYINQKYLSKEFVTRYSKAKFLLSKEDNKIVMEVKEPSSVDKIVFVDRVEGYQFKNIRESKKFLASLLKR